jgi:hypothetical protein
MIVGLVMRIWFWETMLTGPAVLLAIDWSRRSERQ